MAVGDLPILDVTSYNGFDFPENVETVAYRVEPLMDPARRTVWGCKFNISLHWIDSDPEARGGSLNARNQDMTARLTKSGGELKYRGRATGLAPTINGGARVRDVSWGPVPGPLETKIHGGTTTEHNWSVEFTIPTCNDAVYFGIAWFCYSLQFDRDSHGYSTRRYSAKLRIAQTKITVDSRIVNDSADRYTEVITPALLPEFRRESVSRTLSEDRSELTLNVTDIEIPPTAPPPGVVEADFSHAYNSKGLAEFIGVISARYQIPKGGNVRDALIPYYLLVSDRTIRALRMKSAAGAVGLSPDAVAALPSAVCVVPLAFGAEEVNVYGRTEVKLSFTYRVAGVFFEEVVQNGGLWSPVPKKAGGDWKAWSTSVPNSFSPRGFANLAFTPGEDRLLDLCRAGSPTPPGSGTGTVATRAAAVLSRGGSLEAAVAAAFPKPKPDASWLEYRPIVTISAATGRVPITTLPTAPLSSAPRQNTQSAWNAYKSPLPSAPTGSPGLIPGAQVTGANKQTAGGTSVQQRTSPTYYLTFSGTALRANYPIPVPELLDVNNRKPVLIGTPQFAQAYVPGSLTPLVRAWWQQTYVFSDELLGAPTQPIGPAPTALA